MNWKEKAEAFRKAGGTPAQKKEQEFIARKILRGLGWTDKQLPLLARELSLDPDSQTLDTALDALNYVSDGMFTNTSANQKFVVDTRQIRFSKAFLEGVKVVNFCEAASSLPENGGVLVFFRSPKDENKCMTAIFLHEPVQGYLPGWLLNPVCTLYVRRGNVSMWTRETVSLIRDMASDLNWAVPEAPIDE